MRKEPVSTLPGPSRRIIVEPVQVPAPPEEQPVVVPHEEPAERPEPVPAP